MEDHTPEGAERQSAPSGAPLNALAAFVPAWEKWLAGKRPGNFNNWLSVRTPEGRKIPTPGANWLAVIR